MTAVSWLRSFLGGSAHEAEDVAYDNALYDLIEFGPGGAVNHITSSTLNVTNPTGPSTNIEIPASTYDAFGSAAAAQAAAEAASDPLGSAAVVQSLSLQKSANLSDVPTPATARTNLGLGTAATHAAGDFYASSTTIDAINTAIANWSNGGYKIIHLANGSASDDAAAFGQIPTIATTVTGPDAFGAAAVVGTGANWSPDDHNHGLPANPVTAAAVEALQGLPYTVFGGMRTGALAETMPRALITSTGFVPTSAQLQMVAIWLPIGLVIGHITFLTITGITGPQNQWFGLYDSSRVQLATTADDTSTAWANNTEKTLAIATVASGAASTFQTTYTGLHYLGATRQASGTIGSLAGFVNNQGNVGISLAPILSGGSDTTQTSPPAFPHTAGTITGAAFLYAYVS